MTGPTVLHAVSVNHHHAPTQVREQAHLSEEQAVVLMQTLDGAQGCVSAIPVSTCNRTEIYLEVAPEADARELLRRGLQAAGCDAELFFSAHAVTYEGLEVVKHLFRLSAGLESMMVGEPQISGQLKDAYRLARNHQEPGPGLLRAFQGAFRAGKRVRTETQISAGAVSVAFAAVELSRKFFARLHDQKAVLVGAGETGALAARHFLQHEIGHLTVVNRSGERAQALAAALTAEMKTSPGVVVSRPWQELTQAIAEADVILSTTGATEPVILPDMVRTAVEHRKGKPLFLLDIAVPRDVHPDVAHVGGVYLFGLDDLDEVVKGNLEARRRQIPHAERIIKEELVEFQQWLAEVDLRPTVAEFKAYLEELKDKQVGFVAKKESAEIAAAVDRSLQQFIKKVLGRSVSTLKEAETPEDRQRDLEVLRRIFSDKGKEEA